MQHHIMGYYTMKIGTHRGTGEHGHGAGGGLLFFGWGWVLVILGGWLGGGEGGRGGGGADALLRRFFSVSPRRAHRARQRGTPKRPQIKINEKRPLKFQRRTRSQVLSTRPRTQSGLTTGGPAQPIIQGEVSRSARVTSPCSMQHILTPPISILFCRSYTNPFLSLLALSLSFFALATAAFDFLRSMATFSLLASWAFFFHSLT